MANSNVNKKGTTRTERYKKLSKSTNYKKKTTTTKKTSTVKKTNTVKKTSTVNTNAVKNTSTIIDTSPEKIENNISFTKELEGIEPIINFEKPVSTINKKTIKKIDELYDIKHSDKEEKKTKKHLKLKRKFLILILISILLAGCIVAYEIITNTSDKENKENKENVVVEPTPTPEPVDTVEETELSLIMVGDCLIHGSIYLDAQEGNTYNFYKMLDRIKPIVSSYDLAYYNQESILGGKSLGLQSYPRFNSPQEIGDAMLDAGFNIVTFANNHSLDMGEKGILSALSYWNTKKDQGIMMAGSYSSFEDRNKDVIMEKNGITYTILSYTTTLNGLSIPSGKEYLVNYYNPEQVKKDIERLRDKVDLLMVAMHWGEEYTHTPNNNQKEIAEYLSSLGVDIIIGHHPHVIQPIDFIGNTMVIYSLGNFIASQKGEIAKHTGLMASVKVHKTTVNGKSSITLLEPTAQLEYVYSVPVSSNARKNYKLYPYEELNDSLLKGYKDYYYKFMDIVTKYNKNILYKEL